jgi:molybdate/tungstate transport system ATP-binding protein
LEWKAIVDYLDRLGTTGHDAVIDVQNMSVRAGSFKLEGVSLYVPTGGYGVLMGKTGSGKTTILESIIGLRSIVSGKILLHDRDVTNLQPAARGIGYVPQDGALFSTMTVHDQMAMALTIRGVSTLVIRQRVEALAEVLGITHLLQRKPHGLSGGERQRVALGRALSFRPRVLCLDEPLSALDDETRHQICELLANVRKVTEVTTLHITHNIHEADMLADCRFQIQDGSIDKVD